MARTVTTKKHTHTFILWGIALALLAGVVALSACGAKKTPASSGSQTPASATTTAGAPQTFPTVTAATDIKTPADWKSAYPEEVSSFLADTTPLTPVKSYLDIFPFLKTIYAGNAFTKSYNTPEPHQSALADAKRTPRIGPKSTATCYSCKTPQYAIAQQTQGEKIASIPFTTEASNMTVSITCYDCHKNYPGKGSQDKSQDNGTFLGSTREAFNTAFASTISSGQMQPANAACGQCHNEYYFDPKTGAVAMPKGLTDPFKIFAYYNKIGLTDYINPNTGAHMLKVQHPEYDMCADNTDPHASLSCADCHMEKNADGTTNHKMTGPLYSAQIRKDVCLSCHTGTTDAALLSELKQIKAAFEGEIITNGNELAKFTDQLAAANKSGKYTAAQLDPIRAQEREAQWYLDWVLTENSKGVHNPTEASACFNQVQTVTKAGEAAIAALLK